MNLLSRFMANPTTTHWLARKQTLKYIQGTTSLRIQYKKGTNNLRLLAFSDSDYVGDLDDRKNTSGYVFMLGQGKNNFVGIQEVKQVALSVVEYITVVLGVFNVCGLANCQNKFDIEIRLKLRFCVIIVLQCNCSNT